MAKVSVILPVYNTEKYLPRCLDALVNQTLEDLEIIAVDDGSTDHSPAVLKKYAGIYGDKIRIITKENEGQAAARNMGIRASRGKYIGFADSDDCVDVSMFEKMYLLAEERKCHMVECHYHYIQETEKGNKELHTRGNIRQHANRRDMFIDPQVSPWNKLYLREILLRPGLDFPEGLIYEDTSFYIKTIPYVLKSAYLDERLVYYFLRNTSTMNVNKNKKVADIFCVLQDILDFYRRYGFYEQFEKELEYFCTKILLCSSLSRIGRVKDAALEKELLDRTFCFVSEKFPEYKKNPYFTGKTGWYIKHINRRNSKYIGKILGHVMKG